MKSFNFFLLWIFGFFTLLAFDLFVEAFIFEWLDWNGTNKNDSFFALWWGVVADWFFFGLTTLFDLKKTN